MVVLLATASIGACSGADGDAAPATASAGYSNCELHEDSVPPFLYWSEGETAEISTASPVIERVTPRNDSAEELRAARLENERNSETAFVLDARQIEALTDLGSDAVSIVAYTDWYGPVRLPRLLLFVMPDESVVIAGECAAEYADALESFAEREGLTASIVLRTIVANSELGVAVSPYQSGIDVPDFVPIEQ